MYVFFYIESQIQKRISKIDAKTFSIVEGI